MSGLQGLDELRSCLATLADKSAKKAAKAGINAGLMELKKAIVAGVNSSSMTAAEKQAARKTVGKSLKKKGDDYAGKAGFGVGKPSQKKKEAARARAQRGQRGTNDDRGVGISASNIHWLMGTGERRTASGHATGKMPEVLNGIIAGAVSASDSQMVVAAAEKVRKVLASEAAKARR